MATVTERTRGTLEIIFRIELSPPVGSLFNLVSTPRLMGHIPLCREWEVVIADLFEIALLPFAPVNERDVVLREGDQRIRLGKVRDDRVRMLPRIAHNIGHQRLAPAFVNIGVAFFAGCRTGELSGDRARGDGRYRGDGHHFRKIPDERDHLPDVLVRHPPARHGGVPYAILDEIEQLAIGPFLNLRTAQNDWRRILAASRIRLPASIVTVTDLAFLLVKNPAGSCARTSNAERILKGF